MNARELHDATGEYMTDPVEFLTTFFLRFIGGTTSNDENVQARVKAESLLKYLHDNNCDIFENITRKLPEWAEIALMAQDHKEGGQ